MLKLGIKKHQLQFAFPATTSRGTLHTKDVWYVMITDTDRPGVVGLGECSPIWGLSPEKEETYEEKLNEISKRIEDFDQYLRTGLAGFPSIRFGIETALMDFYTGGRQVLFPSEFTQGKTGIKINGLVWMGDAEKMLHDGLEKISLGFSCIKLKIGVHNWGEEEKVIAALREKGGEELQIRVDANGAFTYDKAMRVMEKLAVYNVHSIEQPLAPGNIKDMALLAANAPVAVALDEELIGKISETERKNLLNDIKPQYIVLKPSLAGGLAATREWINLAAEVKSGWWITSMLESNVGLNAIAQFTATLHNVFPQGLGTGKIYTNNISSPLYIQGDELFFAPDTP